MRAVVPINKDRTPFEHVAELARRRQLPDVFTVAAEYVGSDRLRPTVALYDLLIACAAAAPHDRHKSTAFSLLADMRRRQSQLPNASIYLSLLRLLAKSPDYLRRAEVLDEMRGRWIALTDDAWAWVVLGYLKDLQVELALEMVREREAHGLAVGIRVYTDLLARLIELGEASEACDLLLRVEADVGAEAWRGALSLERRNRVWHDLLLIAARDMHVFPPPACSPPAPHIHPPRPPTDVLARRQADRGGEDGGNSTR